MSLTVTSEDLVDKGNQIIQLYNPVSRPRSFAGRL